MKVTIRSFFDKYENQFQYSIYVKTDKGTIKSIIHCNEIMATRYELSLRSTFKIGKATITTYVGSFFEAHKINYEV